MDRGGGPQDIDYKPLNTKNHCTGLSNRTGPSSSPQSPPSNTGKEYGMLHSPGPEPQGRLGVYPLVHQWFAVRCECVLVDADTPQDSPRSNGRPFQTGEGYSLLVADLQWSITHRLQQPRMLHPNSMSTHGCVAFWLILGPSSGSRAIQLCRIWAST